MSAGATVALGRQPLARVIHHERIVVENLLFRSSATWRERVRWVLALPVLIAFAHFWLSTMPPASASRTAAGSAWFLSLSITRAAAKRLAFHRSDGLMAPDALRNGVGWQYRALYVSLALIGITVAVALLDRRVLPACLAAMGGGVLAGALLNLATSFGAIRRAWAVILRVGAAWLRRPSAGIVLAAVFGAIAWPLTRVLPDMTALTTTGSLAFACCFFLSPVDAALVRFMAQSGFAIVPTLRAYGWGLLAFVPPAAAIAFTLLGAAGLALIVAVAAIAAAILCLRVLTYRLYDKWAADWIATLLTAVLALVGVSFAPALPVVAAVVIWTLWRRARATTWLFAA